MSNKLEAALGGEPVNRFVDRDGDVYEVERYGTGESALIEVYQNGCLDLAFLASDATKIIALIAEAAK